MRASLRGIFAVAGALCALAGAAVLAPADGAAQQRSRPSTRGFTRSPWFDDWGVRSDWGWTELQQQRESLASQEELAREAARVKIREEVDKQQALDAAAHEEYFSSLLEASRAALRAPQGVYFRRPGFLSSAPPGPDAVPVQAGGTTFLYERGVFWLQQGQQYVVVTAPPGAVIDALPAGAYPVQAGEGTLQYFFGAFYRESAGRYEVVTPPPGVAVIYVPDGYTTEQRNGATIYRYGSIGFRPVFIHGVLAYQVVGP